ncbi:acyl-CoA reductase [Celerinatantimonas diazotrophica]|uniref:Acyl-CoA reductase LuxC n=1 Tax=Celerinatantimonas diazotrophica TaxID=412034 RepID=A0A4R1KAM9_9GAMM|nr:acyl-CoA reductase [Celerinatantimonas diazotrophica]TCK61100.1 acyl-CoA reductase LuxC [Celerinatantimonas diazotrophica]CAG9295149.1 hypothetical protein CEDIAZO_00261 [Celerinatantimonas diazotrophica]
MQRYLQLTDDESELIQVEVPQKAQVQTLNLEPLPCYAPVLMEFFTALSDALGHLSDAPNARALGFFLRARALEQAVAIRQREYLRAPRGLSFHLVPANVPMVAFHSAFASLLQGNPTIVRLSSRQLPEQQQVLETLNRLLSQARWHCIAQRIRFVRYPHSDALTAALSRQCRSRVIWGGDATIQQVRNYPISAGALEVTFADRQSLAVFDEQSLRQMPGHSVQLQLQQLAQDISQFAQQSCSSPGALVWIGTDSILRQKTFAQLSGYIESSICRGSTQLALLQKACLERRIKDYDYFGNLGWGQLNSLEQLPPRQGGTVYWQQFESMDAFFKQSINYQTCVIVGGSRESMKEQLVNAPQVMIDRIVAPGQALAFDWLWDGVDLLSVLSRMIV